MTISTFTLVYFALPLFVFSIYRHHNTDCL